MSVNKLELGALMGNDKAFALIQRVADIMNDASDLGIDLEAQGKQMAQVILFAIQEDTRMYTAACFGGVVTEQPESLQ